jgi:molybdopterin-guanine dinucleotide biosynthesis protein A
MRRTCEGSRGRSRSRAHHRHDPATDALERRRHHAITVEDLRKIEVWTARHGVALADWPTEPVDPFFNVNTPEDVEMATQLAASEKV